MVLTTPQLIMLRSLKTKGWPVDLISYCWTRAGENRVAFDDLVSAGYVVISGGRYSLTRDGKRELTEQSRGKYF